SRRVLLRGGEDERQGGALLFLGLHAPLDLTAESREFPSPMHFVQAAREQNDNVWIDIEKPFWWDVPTWLASGRMNSLGIANNHMCRSSMLDNEAWGRPRDLARLPGPHGNGYWSQEIYYHALNAGLRLPPSAGSASGVLPNPVGYNRIYAQLGDAPMTADNWLQAVAQGRTFVTNGPLLRVTANTQPAGDALQLPREGALRVKLDVRLTSLDRISTLEVIHNGRVVRSIPCTAATSQQLTDSFLVEQPGWFLVRAIADVDHTFRFASTAPWYIDGPQGEQFVSRASSSFFLDWVDKRIAQLEQTVTQRTQLAAVLEPHRNARIYWAAKVNAATHDLQKEDETAVARSSAQAAQLPMAGPVDAQPLLAATARLIEAMDYVGSPLPPNVVRELQQLSEAPDQAQTAAGIQQLLDPLCLAGVSVQPEGRPVVRAGQAPRQLLEQGWRTFLVKVVNRPGLRRRLLIESPNAQPLPHAPADQVQSRWMQLSSFEGRPLTANLSGLELEYRIVQIYSRDTGNKNALLEFTISNKPGDAGALIREWRFGTDTDGWNAMNQLQLEAREGSLFATATGDDPFMGAEVDSRGGPMLLRFWAKSEEDGIGQLFWWTKDRPQPTGDRQTNYLVEPGEEKLYEVPFHVDGELAGVRIDPLVKPGKIRIDWIDLYSAERAENWAKLPLDFQAESASRLTFRVIDDEGLPAFAKFEIRDVDGRIYPAQSKRLAPDFFFQRHIYRGDGESIALPPGQYTIKCSRGPETLPETQTIMVGKTPAELVYRVQRWVDPSRDGWWSGDHHIHAAGCLHYNNPTEGVEPADMIRHIMGEDLKVGCCLTWGPCFDFQKRFFTGEVAEQSRYPYTLRYDVEVSGFGSHMSGHLNLLNLKEQIYPGGESKDHWPTLGLNTLRWAKRQGAVCGPAHSSIGLTSFIGRLPDTDGKDGPHNLPNFQLPAFDGIGANEFIMDVTHSVPGPDGTLIPAVDFISTMNTERVAEWNMWYHVLNCGFQVAASGETDFPCMSGDRVGIGRVYAKVDGRLTFAKWVQAIGKGRSYVSDGFCHLMDYAAKANSSDALVSVGAQETPISVQSGESIDFEVTTAAQVNGQDTLTAELIVNGYPVATKTFAADASTREIRFRHTFKDSSWAAVRVFPHAHTNPIFVSVEDRPIRASVDSARWCLEGVRQCRKSKLPGYDASEQQDAATAFDHAERVYQSIIEQAQRRQKEVR
ncbi:MAG: CehA/McbA family metallohydrolase, partial [Planctomycetaceae bacterium]|nr:CehA/McbA family metallohydrolase [Planctomycetaceae bacterium]